MVDGAAAAGDRISLVAGRSPRAVRAAVGGGGSGWTAGDQHFGRVDDVVQVGNVQLLGGRRGMLRRRWQVVDPVGGNWWEGKSMLIVMGFEVRVLESLTLIAVHRPWVAVKRPEAGRGRREGVVTLVA